VMEVQVIIEEGLLVLLNGYWLYIAVDWLQERRLTRIDSLEDYTAIVIMRDVHLLIKWVLSIYEWLLLWEGAGGLGEGVLACGEDGPMVVLFAVEHG
jgi:hypothetical protein